MGVGDTCVLEPVGVSVPRLGEDFGAWPDDGGGATLIVVFCRTAAGAGLLGA